ncbi:ATP-binding cassette domain-containing protein [Mycoplasmatota bacterium zrk1]
MLRVENVTKRYGELVAVNKLSFEVKKGEIFGLLGLNGAGKTTTFRMILNLFTPDEGHVYLNDDVIGYEHSNEIGFLSEERSLLVKMTVLDQLTYYGKLKSLPTEELLKSIDYWLNRFNITKYKNKKIKELSKGNQQKIQFISAIIHNPKLLILDEPFNGLDPINVELFKEVILEFKSKGATIIFSSHRMEHVEMFCEKLVILVDGESILSGYIKDIKNSFSQQNIFIKGDIIPEDVSKIEGVIKVINHTDRFEVKINNKNHVKDVFNYTSKCDNVSLFEVELPSLNEIFVSKVGVNYEK